MTLRTHLKIAGRLTFGNLGVKRRPLRIRANSLKTEPCPESSLGARRTDVS